jgi:hypothetical protein
MLNKDENYLVLGFCMDGPYSYAVSVLENPRVNWIPWSYHITSVHPNIVSELEKGLSLANKRVIFSRWESKYTGKRPVIRRGTIDYFKYTSGIIRMTVKLDELIETNEDHWIDVHDPKILCFYYK